jgi:hypothetical protein
MTFTGQIAAAVITPSPLVGEGIFFSRPGHEWVSGTGTNVVLQTPLTHLRFATAPSPTRREGKNPSTQRRQPT